MHEILVWWHAVDAWWRPVIVGLFGFAICGGIALLFLYLSTKQSGSAEQATQARRGFAKLFALLIWLPIAAIIPTFGTFAGIAFEAAVGVSALAYSVVIYWRGAPRHKIAFAVFGGLLLVGTAAFPQLTGRGAPVTVSAVLLLLMSLHIDRTRTV